MIRWITQHLGTAARDQVGDSSGIEIVDVRNMVDKEGNRREVAWGAVEETVKLLRDGKRVVVCCDYGMSRSNAVAAGALAVHDHIAFGDAVREVILRTGEREIKTDVLSAIEDAIAQRAGPVPLSASGDRNRILVTGGSGFIGKRLMERLGRTSTLFAPSRSEVDLSQGSAELSLLLKEHRVGQLIHLASPRIFNSNAAVGQMVVALKNAIDACRAHRIRLLFVSGWVVYSGYRCESLLASESLPANPKGSYGQAKWLCERMLEQEKLIYPDFDYTIVRLAPLYGAGSDKPRFIYRFMDLASRGEPIVTHRYANGLPVLDLTHVDDAVSALALAAQSASSGEYTEYNVGAGCGVSTTAVAETIVELMGSRSSVSQQQIEEFAPNILMDSARVRKVLGWRPEANLRTELSNLILTTAEREMETH